MRALSLFLMLGCAASAGPGADEPGAAHAEAPAVARLGPQVPGLAPEVFFAVHAEDPDAILAVLEPTLVAAGVVPEACDGRVRGWLGRLTLGAGRPGFAMRFEGPLANEEGAGCREALGATEATFTRSPEGRLVAGEAALFLEQGGGAASAALRASDADLTAYVAPELLRGASADVPLPELARALRVAASLELRVSGEGGDLALDVVLRGVGDALAVAARDDLEGWRAEVAATMDEVLATQAPEAPRDQVLGPFEDAAILAEGESLALRIRATPQALGVIAAVAIPAFLNYVKRSKAREARTNLLDIAGGALAYAEARGRFPPSAGPTPATIPGSETALVTFGGAWAPLGIAGSMGVFYRYTFVSDGQRFTATAEGDLDGDGELSRYAISGRFEGGRPVIDAELQVVDALE